MDRYDAAIQYLKENPRMIYPAWGYPRSSRGGSLFLFCAKNNIPAGLDIGCLTMVKDGDEVAEDEELTRRIRNDPRIPDDVHGVTVENLPVFAEYQREMDAMWPGRSDFKTADDEYVESECPEPFSSSTSGIKRFISSIAAIKRLFAGRK